MKPLLTLTRVEASLQAREPAALAFTLVLPLILLVLNGSGGNAPDPAYGGAGRVDVFLAGYLVYVIATTAIMNLATTLADYRDRGILRRLRVTPLRPWQILGSHAVTHLVVSLAGVALLVVVARLAYDASVPDSILATLLAVTASAVCLISLGFLLGAVLPTVRTTQAVAAALYFPSIFISGAIIPREGLPTFARHIADVLPMTYAVDSIREAWTGGRIDGGALAILGAVTVVATVVAVKTFRWEAR